MMKRREPVAGKTRLRFATILFPWNGRPDTDCVGCVTSSRWNSSGPWHALSSACEQIRLTFFKG
jgi:hypothetical protein